MSKNEGVQSRLIAAATDVIASGRHVSMPLRAVAERAGATTGAIQHHFGNREGLLLAVLRQHGERVVDRLHSRRSAEPPSPPGVARAILLEFLPLDDERRAEARVAIAFEGIATTNQDLAAAYREQYALLAGLIAEHLPGSEAPDIELVLATIGGIRVDLLLGRVTHDHTVHLVDHLLARFSGPGDPSG